MAGKSAGGDQGDQYEVLTPPSDLRKKVRVLNKREAAKFDPVKAAEAAMERLSANFGSWMQTETSDLLSAYADIGTSGVDAEKLERLYQSVHNIKGQARTLGYPLVGSVASNFCHLIESLPSPSGFPMELSGRYVDAIRAMVMEGARDHDNETGAELLQTLTSLSEDHLRKIRNSDD
ncbi:Hpt domain-containing protein [Roseibium sp. RKSG952]|nr:Hpt domain-containing protein [Roseibium sp. RKSG952]